MTLHDFMQAVDTYGADLSRWPDGLREKAQAAMTKDERVFAYWRESAALEERLRSFSIPAEGGAIDKIYAAVLERINGNIVRLEEFFQPRAALASSLALVAAAVFGVYIGFGPASQDAVLDPAFYEAQTIIDGDIDEGNIL